MNFHPDKQLFQVAGAGDQTTDPWITKPALYLYTMGDPLHMQPKNIMSKTKRGKIIVGQNLVIPVIVPAWKIHLAASVGDGGGHKPFSFVPLPSSCVLDSI